MNITFKKKLKKKLEKMNDKQVIIFDLSKQPKYTLTKELSLFNKKFKNEYKFIENREIYTNELLELYQAQAIIFLSPSKKFTSNELIILKQFLENGGNLLFMSNEKNNYNSNKIINTFIHDYHIQLNNDCLVRNVYYRGYYHPKEAVIKSCSLMQSIDLVSDKLSLKKQRSKYDDIDPYDEDKLKIVYPYGCTLTCNLPSLPMLTSGDMCFPANRALLAMNNSSGNGKLFVLGSSDLFHNLYLEKEDNYNLAIALLKYLTNHNEAKIDKIDHDLIEFDEKAMEIPDIEALSERLRGCLEDNDDIPSDWTKLYDLSLFKYDIDLIPQAISLYKKLNIEHEPLSVIPPKFDVPLPELQPAVFDPILNELPPPSLELYDLDEKFASEKLRLAQLTNKCNKNDLEYFIREAGEILGINDLLRDQYEEKNNSNANNYTPNGKEILHAVLKND